MGDLLRRGSDWLEQQRTQHLTTNVCYIRGFLQTILPATIGRTRFQTDDGTVLRVEYTDRDFLILVEHLLLNAEPVLPERGDQILEYTDPKLPAFEVLDWRYSDPYRQTLRISTKYMGLLESWSPSLPLF